MKNYIYAQTQTRNNYKRYKSITSKQWLVYYYLLSVSHYDAQEKEDHRFVYKKDLNISKISKTLGISRPTFYSALKVLTNFGLVIDYGLSYSLYSYQWVKIDLEILKALITFTHSNAKDIDLLRTYLFLKKLYLITTVKEERQFTRRELIQLLGHDITTVSNYKDIQIYLGLLSYWNLIEIKSHVEQHPTFGHYIVYHLERAGEEKVNPDLLNNDIGEMHGSAMPERIYNSLLFTMPEIAEADILKTKEEIKGS